MLSVPEQHVGGVQDLTLQPVGSPGYPNMNGANSAPLLCLLREEGGSGISPCKEETPHPRLMPFPPKPFPRAMPGASP